MLIPLISKMVKMEKEKAKMPYRKMDKIMNGGVQRKRGRHKTLKY